jgi:pimeloyl-ACP methyl ester carboxylesterase
MAIKTIVYDGVSYDISYELYGDNTKETVIFLHGWGSSKEVMRDSFLRFCDDFRVLFLDLPGFGNSSILKPLHTREYADIVDMFLKALHVEKNIIFGHSFGGKVATILKPKILVLLSSAGIINQKSLKVRLKIKIYKFLKPIFGNSLYKIFATKDVDGLSQVMYETLKRVVDEDFSKEFASFENPALVYWGRDDEAVPLSNAHKINSLMKNSKLRVYEGGHFFFLKNAQKICIDFKEDMDIK